MSIRLGFLSLLCVPGLASFSVSQPPSLVVEIDDSSLSRVNGVLLRDHVRFRGLVVEHDSNGVLIAATMYNDGVRDGAAEAWYPNGQRSFHRTYRQGREDGDHTGWWDNGQMRFAYRYDGGLIEGVAREWFRDGTLYREYHYAAGHESGSQRMWWPDGGLRANYVIRDGRRYGLPGIKGCDGATGRESLIVRGRS